MHDSVVLTSPRGPATLASTPSSKRRPLVMVLGMHRSGTSLCSQVLSALGVDMVDWPAHHGSPERGNARGHWERWEIVGLHDRILDKLNRRYYDPTHDFGFPGAWWADPAIADVYKDIIAFLQDRMGEAYFGFKDPRTVRLLPLWHQIVRELKLAPKFVFCLRNPAQVARSLRARDGLAPEIGEARWFAYVIDFFRYSIGAEFCLVEYEAWFDDAARNARKLCDFLELNCRQPGVDLERTVSGIIEPALRHDDYANSQAKQPLVRSVYELARRADTDRTVRGQIRELGNQFIGYQRLQGGIQRGLEQIAAAAARLPAIEQETAILRGAIAKRDAAIERCAARAIAGEARAAEAESARERAELEARERQAALDASQAEIAGLRGRLAVTERDFRARVAQLEAATRRIQSLSEAAFRAEREPVPAASSAKFHQARRYSNLIALKLGLRFRPAEKRTAQR